MRCSKRVHGQCVNADLRIHELAMQLIDLIMVKIELASSDEEAIAIMQAYHPLLHQLGPELRKVSPVAK